MTRLKQACLQEAEKIANMKDVHLPPTLVSVNSYEEDQELAFQSELFHDRSREINEIELQLSSVKELMQETASTVYSQGASLDRLDTFVDQTVVQSSKAVDELEKSSVLQQRGSQCACRGWLLWVAVLTSALVIVRYLIDLGLD
jgi:t-SNARE complex subunit (syntaxin)